VLATQLDQGSVRAAIRLERTQVRRTGETVEERRLGRCVEQSK
jgi:hypothetical protein